MENNERQTLKGQCFSPWPHCPAVAGQYSQIQLFNPAASGKLIVVKGFNLYAASGNANFSVGLMIGSLTTNYAAMPAGIKYTGSSVAKGYYENGTGIVINSGYTRMRSDVNGHLDVKFEHPFVIPEGYGLHIVSGDFTNLELNANFEIEEIDV